MNKHSTGRRSSDALLREIDALRRKEAETLHAVHDLGERVKELRCLYAVAQLLQKTDLSLGETLRRALESLTAAYQHPDITCARAVLEGAEYRTEGFRATVWKQAAAIAVEGHEIGTLEVCYREERPAADEGPFLKEERELIDTVATLLSRNIKDRYAWSALAESEAKFRAIYDSDVIPMMFWRMDGRVTEANDAFLKLVGCTREELERGAINWAELTPPEYLHLDRQAVEELERGRRSIASYEKEYQLRDGRRVPVLMGRSVLPGRRGGVGFAIDLTERKRAETALRRADAYHRSLIEASLDPLVTIGPDGTITDVNAATEAVTGRSRAELVGTDFSDYFTEPARARAGYRQVFREGAVRDYALEIRHRDGRLTPVLYNASVYPDEGGNVIGVFAAARDISAVKRAQEALRVLNVELEQRVAERTAALEAAVHELEGISYSVSHDLRTPVRAVDGFAGILLQEHGDALNAEGRRIVNVIRANTKRMGRLIDDILAFLRLGRTAMGPLEFDMNELAREVVEDLESLARGRSAHIEFKPMPPARGDRAMLRQVLANLLGNALKFTRPRETGWIEVGGEARERENVYWVKDNGVGFDMRYAGKLFGVFQRLHGVEEFEGTGIGLAIVHRIVERHGGRVWAEGKVNQGAAFYFALPRP